MAIKYTNERGQIVSTEYEGRVIETKSFSGSAFIQYENEKILVSLLFALVWNGPTGEYYDQFKWIDCSNVMWIESNGDDTSKYKNDHRGGLCIVPEIDVSTIAGTGDPIMWVNYFAWKSYHDKNKTPLPSFLGSSRYRELVDRYFPLAFRQPERGVNKICASVVKMVTTKEWTSYVIISES